MKLKKLIYTSTIPKPDKETLSEVLEDLNKLEKLFSQKLKFGSSVDSSNKKSLKKKDSIDVNSLDVFNKKNISVTSLNKKNDVTGSEVINVKSKILSKFAYKKKNTVQEKTIAGVLDPNLFMSILEPSKNQNDDQSR